MGFMSKKQQPVARRRMVADEQAKERATPAELSERYNFRRNRTLTGSLSSEVSSVNEHRAELKSPRVHAHHLRKHRRHAFGALVGTLAACAGLWFLITQAITSTTVTAPGADYGFNATYYQQKIHDYLAVHPFEHFRFALNTSALTNYLWSHGVPEVESVVSVKPSQVLGTATVTMRMRQPAVVWQSSGVKTYVDNKGNSFAHNYYAEPTVQVVDQTGIQAQGDQVLASNHLLSFIGQVVGRMKDSGYTVEQIILPANTTRQVQVVVQQATFPIKFSIDRPVGEQAEDASRVITYVRSKGITPEYVDVRVSGRAFYK